MSYCALYKRNTVSLSDNSKYKQNLLVLLFISSLYAPRIFSIHLHDALVFLQIAIQLLTVVAIVVIVCTL